MGKRCNDFNAGLGSGEARIAKQKFYILSEKIRARKLSLKSVLPRLIIYAEVMHPADIPEDIRKAMKRYHSRRPKKMNPLEKYGDHYYK